MCSLCKIVKEDVVGPPNTHCDCSESVLIVLLNLLVNHDLLNILGCYFRLLVNFTLISTYLKLDNQSVNKMSFITTLSSVTTLHQIGINNYENKNIIIASNTNL